ncbi:hypothetical protein Q6304_28450, partial [Klebsiella pneumoniae]|nr:hypothetical protein [Klebsiella pneumoniae]
MACAGLALGLAQQGFTVTVLEKAAPPAFEPASAPDVRISAISAASVGQPDTRQFPLATWRSAANWLHGGVRDPAWVIDYPSLA